MAFKFEKNTITLEFENNLKFEVDAQKTGDVISKYTKIFEDIRTGTAEDKTNEDVCNKVVCAIDEILGEGSTKKIFGERTIKLWDLVDVWTYICNEQAYFHERKRNKIYQNRQQRRHNKK